MPSLGLTLQETPGPVQGTAAMLQAALAADEADDLNTSREPLSPTLISICRPYSPSPTRKRDLNASFGDSPSIILMESAQWTPRKVLSLALSPAVSSPSSPPSPPSPRSPPPCSSRRRSPSEDAPRKLKRNSSAGSKKDRPVRCGSIEPLSARGRERHSQEMAKLGLKVDGDGSQSARGPQRPRGRGGRHFAMVGGA